jgi:hypothetical protein
VYSSPPPDTPSVAVAVFGDAQPGGGAGLADVLVVVGGVVRGHGADLLAELGGANIEVGEDVQLDGVLVVAVDEKRALREVVTATVISKATLVVILVSTIQSPEGVGSPRMGNLLRCPVLIGAVCVDLIAGTGEDVGVIRAGVDEVPLAGERGGVEFV